MTPPYKSTTVGKSPFGDLLTRLRTQRGLTQEGLAAATGGDRISSRSITNYERSVNDKRSWILPHRPGLRSLAEALDLDANEHREFVDAWHKTRALKDAVTSPASTPNYVSQGRESIVGQIMDAWEIAKSGRPRFVALGGDSGIGKTTLARHVCDIIAASTPEVMITSGEAHSWATPVEPYLSIRHATDRILVPPPASFTMPGLYPNRPSIPDQLIKRVVQSIPQLGGVLISESTIRDLAEAGNDAIGLALNLRSATESLGRWDEYGNLLTCMTKSWPIVMVLDDMHWASDLTCSLLQHLAHHLGNRTDTPLLILATYRSNELLPREGEAPHPFAKLLQATSRLDSVSQIHMSETLRPDQGSSFIRGVVSNLPMLDKTNENALVTWLYQRTSGQPMLTIELLRHLRETGGLLRIPRAGAWKFDPQQVPEGLSPAISTLIGQRVAPIDRRSKFVLEVAAAMGETILPEIMADLLRMNDETLQDVIDSALVKQHEMLLPGTSVTFGQRSYYTYRFPHALLREYVYAEIPPIRRRRIHLEIAQAFSRAFPSTDGTVMGEVTYHYIMAEDWHSAEMAAYRMAQLQVNRLDWELATVWFDQAENLATRAQDPQQLWRARAARLAVLRGLYRTEEAIELGKRTLAQAELHNWSETIALAHHHLGEVYYDLGQLDKAVEHIEIACRIHEESQSLDLATAALAMLSHATYRQGKYDVARAHAHRALDLSQGVDDSWVRSEAMLAAANCDVDIGFYHEAIDNYRAAIELAAMVGKLSNQFLPALNIGLCLTMLGDHEAAIEQLTATIERMKPHRVPRMIAWGQLYLGFALEESGEYPAALEAFAASEHARRQHDVPPVLYDSIAGLVSVYTRLGDRATVQHHLQELSNHIDTAGIEGLEDAALVLLSMAKGYRLLGNDEEYWHRLEQAHDLIMNRAKQMCDAEARTSYLTRVPTTVEIQKRFSERTHA